MATLKLKYVHAYRDRHGRFRHYYRRRGMSFPLPGNPGESDFMAAYEAAAASFDSGNCLPNKLPKAGTFDALVLAYYRSTEFQGLRPLTQRTYRNRIDRWREEHGAKRVNHLQSRHIREHIAKAAEVSGPHAANGLRSMLIALCRFAVENDWRRDDPTIGVRPIRAKSTGFETWSEADIAAFKKRWPAGSRERLALYLLLFTGQRRGDVVQMGRQHVSGDTIRVVQNKTGARLVIPIHPTLKAAIAETPNDNMTFLVTAFGKPFSAAGFGNKFREWCDAAGLQARSAHGLRKSAATRLANAGCSALQIAAITGHKTLAEVSRYTAAADQERLARDAMDRIG